MILQGASCPASCLTGNSIILISLGFVLCCSSRMVIIVSIMLMVLGPSTSSSAEDHRVLFQQRLSHLS